MIKKNDLNQMVRLLEDMNEVRGNDIHNIKKVLRNIGSTIDTRGVLSTEIHRISREIDTINEVKLRCEHLDKFNNEFESYEDKIVNEFIQQIREGDFKDELGHELIKNDAFIKFLDLWLEHE
ncbi:MAG: hypothetical protein ACRCTZ_13610 [Sarcina sp.]